MKKFFVLPLIAFLLLFGCPGQEPPAKEKVVEYNDYVQVEYVGRFANGEVFDRSAEGDTLNFIAGLGQVIPGFENGVIGMKEGQEKEVRVPPAQGYGVKNGALVQPFDLNELKEQLGVEPFEGMVVNAKGMQGKVTEIRDGIVTIDFNHELAGKTLFFTVKVVSIRKAGE